MLLPLLFSGCMELAPVKPPGPWHDAYLPIEDEASRAFVDRAFAMAAAEFGEPAEPVATVLLRRSRKTLAARRYRIGEDFSLTECADATNGLFVVYIGVDPGHPDYHALLAHECAHLLNPRITDWYMEGLATLFSEQACEHLGVDWGAWKRHFARSRREPYALSYRMMAELRAAFPDEYPDIVRHTAPNARREGWLRIDIDGWIAALPPVRRAEAVEIIGRYADGLERKVGTQYDFTTPAGLP